jgi:hypothetical protein
MNGDDKKNLDDLQSAIEALRKAKTALQFSMVHHGPKSRAAFLFEVGFARGRLGRIAERVYAGLEPPQPVNDDGGPP